MLEKKSQFINNRWVDGAGEVFESRDPASDAVTWRGQAADAGQAAEAVAAARGAFDGWADLGVAERQRFLDVYVQQLGARKEEIVEAICRETGKPRWEARTEVDAMVKKVGISVEARAERCRETQREVAGAVAATRFKPHGVVGVIGPFNRCRRASLSPTPARRTTPSSLPVQASCE